MALETKEDKRLFRFQMFGLGFFALCVLIALVIAIIHWL